MPVEEVSLGNAFKRNKDRKFEGEVDLIFTYALNKEK